MHSLRKPYVSAQGRHHRYVALVCPACLRLVTLRDLGLTSYADLRKVHVPPSTPEELSRQVAALAPSARVSAPAGPAIAPQDVEAVDPEAARRCAIVRFWRSVELFSAQKVESANEREHRYDLEEGEPAPWEEGHRLGRVRIPATHRWKFTVYGGLYQLDRLHGVLVEVFPDNDVDLDERTPRGDSAVFAVEVTEHGQLVLDSLTLSTAAWAVGRAVTPGPDDPGWLEGFPVVEAAHAAAVENAAGRIEDDNDTALSGPVAADFFHWLAKDATHRLGVDVLLAAGGVRVACEQVPRVAQIEAGSNFLNSFIAEDLARVAAAAGAGDCGRTLVDYLSATTPRDRFDVRAPENLDAVVDMLAPDRIPPGRWPANPDHTAATSQQLAINQLMGPGGQTGRPFGVNGPPGTGKTTMLRDLVAAVVTERALCLAELTSAGEAFAEQAETWAVAKATLSFRPLRPELTGFEMLVASSNNTAVENVTREMPARDAVDEVFTGADYLAQFATRVLHAPAWGLVAAPLGNQKNRNGFVNQLWFTERDPDETLRLGLGDWLAEQQRGARPGDWPAAVALFRAAVAREQEVRRSREAGWQALRALPALHGAADRTAEQLAAAQRWAQESADNAHRAGDDARHAEQELQDARARRAEHRTARPTWWDALFTWGRAVRQWYSEDQTLRAAEDTAAARAVESASAARQWRSHAEAAQDQAHQAAAAHAGATAELQAAQKVIDDLRHTHVLDIPDDAWRSDPQLRERRAPWLDPVWDQARSQVFLAALDLHRAFLVCGGRPVMSLLRASIDVVKGKAPPDASPAALKAAWHGLFLLVPVVSTTFASVARMLGPVGRETFGWLLVDEAGQATPQAAVGAMWRCRQIVAVGDPLQLEPVVTILHSTQARLRDHHQVSDTWLPSRQSVQTLVDRVSAIGTSLTEQDEQIWVGAPLRVHRRCDDPMFSIVNSAVYNGLMIHAVPERADPRIDWSAVPASAWYNVDTQHSDGNWIPDEGQVAVRLLRELTTGHSLDPARDILLVTPFRRSAYGLNRLMRSISLPSLPVTGTVHRAQGKQAPVVVFVLGGNPARPGVRQWASARPNLLNVAVSRAMRRLYVIGNHKDWSTQPYFSALAQYLATVEIDQIEDSPGWP